MDLHVNVALRVQFNKLVSPKLIFRNSSRIHYNSSAIMCMLCKRERLFRVYNPCCCCALRCGVLWIAIVSLIYGLVSMILPLGVGIQMSSSNQTDAQSGEGGGTGNNDRPKSPKEYTQDLKTREELTIWVTDPTIVQFSNYGCYALQAVSGLILALAIICRWGGLANFLIGCLWMGCRILITIFWTPTLYAVYAITGFEVDTGWKIYANLILVNMVIHLYFFVVVRYYTMECWDLWVYRPHTPRRHDRMKLQRRRRRNRKRCKYCGLYGLWKCGSCVIKFRWLWKIFRCFKPNRPGQPRRRKFRCSPRAWRHRRVRLQYALKWRNLRRLKCFRKRKRRNPNKPPHRRDNLNRWHRKHKMLQDQWDYYGNDVPVWDMRNKFIIRGEDWSTMDPFRHYQAFERLEASGILELGKADVLDEQRYRQLLEEYSELFVPLQKEGEDGSASSSDDGATAGLPTKYKLVDETTRKVRKNKSMFKEESNKKKSLGFKQAAKTIAFTEAVKRKSSTKMKTKDKKNKKSRVSMAPLKVANFKSLSQMTSKKNKWKNKKS